MLQSEPFYGKKRKNPTRYTTHEKFPSGRVISAHICVENTLSVIPTWKGIECEYESIKRLKIEIFQNTHE